MQFDPSAHLSFDFDVVQLWVDAECKVGGQRPGGGGPGHQHSTVTTQEGGGAHHGELHHNCRGRTLLAQARPRVARGSGACI